MFTYVIGALLLIKFPKAACPEVTQPWYTEDDGELGMFDHLELYVN